MVNGLKGKLVVHEGKNGTTYEVALDGQRSCSGHAGTDESGSL